MTTGSVFALSLATGRWARTGGEGVRGSGGERKSDAAGAEIPRRVRVLGDAVATTCVARPPQRRAGKQFVDTCGVEERGQACAVSQCLSESTG